MKNKGLNIRNNDVINKITEADEDKTMMNFSNFENKSDN